MKRLGAMRAIGLAILCVATSAAAWASGIEDFTLLKAIPADACWAIGARDHAGKEFIKKQTARVMEAVEKAKFDVVLKRFIKQSMEKEGATNAEDFEAHWQKVSELIAGVEWSRLGEREYASGFRLGGPTAPFEFVALMRPPTDKLQPDFDGLVNIFKSLSEMSNGMAPLTSEGEGAQTIHKLTVQGGPIPIIITLALQKEVILFGFGSTMPEQALALLKGEKGASVAAAPRFKEAAAKVAPPSDMVAYCDMAKMFGQVRVLLDEVVKSIPASEPGAPGAEDVEKWKKLPGKVLDLFDMYEVVVSSGTTEGMKTTIESCMMLKADAKIHGFYPILYGEQPLSDPLKYVPKAAGNFSVSSGINLGLLYSTVTKFVKENVPQGGEGIAQVESFAKQQEIDIEKDVFGWIGAGFVSVSIPGATSYAPGDFGYKLKVKDEAKAKEVIGRLFTFLEAQMAGKGGTITDAEVEGAPGFKAIAVPQLSLVGIGKIVIGVNNGWLTVASGPKLVSSLEASAAGKEPNVSANERFAKEGLKPDKNARSVSFSDMTRFGEELSQMVSMMNMAQMAMPPEAQKEPAIGALLAIAGKLPNVLRKLDFFQSESSVSTFDGKLLINKSVVNYREPPAPSTPKPAEPAEKPEKPTTKQ